MLPARHRLTRAAEFGAVVRDGRRTRIGAVVVHQLAPPDAAGDSPPRVGFVVSKAVGGSVVRHRVARRLREQVRPLLTRLPAGSTTVVRALPAASDAASGTLRRDLDAALARLAR